MKQKIYITDCEGPVSKNDNAYEIAEAFLKEGGRLFSLLSKYDDYLGDIEKIQGYKYGSTLKYILPFLKAVNVTDRDVREFSKKHITVMNGIREALQVIRKSMKVYMVSTSYVHYIEEISQYVDLDMENIFSTKVSFDGYVMGEKEKEIVITYHDKFLTLPSISWDEQGNLSPNSQYSIGILKGFFDTTLPSLPVYAWMKDVEPIGGEGKAEAILDIVKKDHAPMQDIMYVGDSITDVNALTLVKSKGGVAISFNGNSYAVLSSEYIVTSRDANILRDMALDFVNSGKEGIKVGKISGNAHIYKKDDCALDDVIRLSERTRKEVRGQAIGSLG